MLLLSPRRKAVASRDGAVLLIAYANYANYLLFVVGLAQQRNNAGGSERPQRCLATRTTGVPDVSSVVKKNFNPTTKFMLAAGAYSWRP